MEMETTYDPRAVEARWLGRREPGSVLPVGTRAADPCEVVADVYDRRAAMGGGDPVDPILARIDARIEPELEDHGVDAFRFGVALLHRVSSPTPRGESRFDQGRHFLHKLWHASRYSLLRLDPASPAGDAERAFEDRWIESRLHRAVRHVGESLDAGRLAQAAERADTFVRREFSEWYLPLVRIRTDPAVSTTAAEVLRVLLPLLHPLVPVVTEEIRNHLSRLLGETPVALEAGTWPVPDDTRIDESVDREMEDVFRIVRKVRSLRSSAGLRHGAEALVRVPDEAAAALVSRHASRIARLADLRDVRAGVEIETPEGSAAGVVGESDVHLTFSRAVDPQVELARLRREFDALSGHVRACERRLSNRDFIERAPSEVVDRERVRRDGLATRIIKIQQHIEVLE